MRDHTKMEHKIRMAQTYLGQKRLRKYYGKIREVLDMPNLIEVQKSSYDLFLNSGDQPEPTPDEEISDIKARIADSEDLERPKVEFEVGETVKINHGAFEGNNGIVEEIDPEKGRLKVTVNIFGRNTPVDVEYWEVDKG